MLSGDHVRSFRLKTEDSGSGDEETDNRLNVDSPPRPPPKLGQGEHALQYNYGFWFSRKSQGNKSASYDQNLKLIGTFASVEQFWTHYSHIVRPSDLTGHTDYHLFKEGIRPMWEEDILSLWNRTANDSVTTSRIRDTLKRVLNLPPNTIMEYKTHNDSLKDNSSFRNTDVFMR